jgi:DNA-binding LacI/PurR family transcriptional regulator
LLLNGLDQMGVAYRIFPARHSIGGCHECLRFLESGEAAGLLLSSSVSQDVIDAAFDRGVPIFGHIGMNPKVKITSGINYTTMVGDALDFFQRSGCRRPALLAWSQADRHLLEVSREAGPEVSRVFKRLAEKRGFSTRNEWLCTDLHPGDRVAGWSGLRDIWSAGRQKPDALLVADSKLLPGAIEAVNDLGIRVPEDFCIISHCNVPESTNMPPEIARLEYRISDWTHPILEGVRQMLAGEKLERQSFEVTGTLIEADGPAVAVI